MRLVARFLGVAEIFTVVGAGGLLVSASGTASEGQSGTALAEQSGAALVMQSQPASTPTAPTTIDVKKLGPQPGVKVPDFSLPDQRGERRTLSSLMGPKGLVLVFIRSADW